MVIENENLFYFFHRQVSVGKYIWKLIVPMFEGVLKKITEKDALSWRAMNRNPMDGRVVW